MQHVRRHGLRSRSGGGTTRRAAVHQSPPRDFDAVDPTMAPPSSPITSPGGSAVFGSRGGISPTPSRGRATSGVRMALFNDADEDHADEGAEQASPPRGRAGRRGSPPRRSPSPRGGGGGGGGSVGAEWAKDLLKSITDVAFIGEEDDSRLLAPIDAWLDGRLPFLQFNRQVNATDAYGNTLLMVAACFGKCQVVRRLLASGASVSLTNESHRDALVYACLGPDLREQKGRILQQLLQAGARGGLKQALEVSALLGRRSSIRVLAAYGALPGGQLVTVLRSTRDTVAGGPMAGLPELRGSLARVVRFDASTGHYLCDVLATLHPTRACLLPANFQLSLLPSELYISLRHLDTERCAPILATAANPLDVAAAALAGAPTERAKPGVTASTIDKVRETTLPIGCTVRVVARPEQWLVGRLGQVDAWDTATARYVVRLNHTAAVPGAGAGGAAAQHDDLYEEARMEQALGGGGPPPMMIKREHLELVDLTAADSATEAQFG